MNKIRAAVVGYGNIGKYAIEAVEAAADFELAGLVRRKVQKDAGLGGHITVTDDIKTLGQVDVVLLCTPTRSVPQEAVKYLSMGINTVDSYDFHTNIWDLHCKLDKAAKENNATAVLSAGWDPGSDSVVRTLMEACAPKGITYTNFGPGMSMGHTVAVKAIEGVKNALSMTIPMGTGVHRRMVYVETVAGADFNAIAKTVKEDPYFVHDETHVIQVPDVDALIDRGHGVNMVRKGVSGETQNQILEFNMSIDNPALTSQIMVACARASIKQQPGAYTMIELPMIDLLSGSKEELIKKLV